MPELTDDELLAGMRQILLRIVRQRASCSLAPLPPDDLKARFRTLWMTGDMFIPADSLEVTDALRELSPEKWAALAARLDMQSIVEG